MDRLLKTSGKLLHMVINARSDGKVIMIKLDKCHNMMGRGSISSFESRLHLGKVREEIEIIRVGRIVVS